MFFIYISSLVSSGLLSIFKLVCFHIAEFQEFFVHNSPSLYRSPLWLFSFLVISLLIFMFSLPLSLLSFSFAYKVLTKEAKFYAL